MKHYPLIKKLVLDVMTTGLVDYIHADDLEQLLQNSTVVYGSTVKHKDEYEWAQDYKQGDTHKALIIAIEPLEEKKVTITRADLEKAFNKAVLGSGECIDYLIKELGL